MSNRSKVPLLRRRAFIKSLIALGFSGGALQSLISLAAAADGSESNSAAGPGLPTNSHRRNLRDRICIIGAGASGISAAHFLKQRGYVNVTVLEASNRIGGKCDTVEIDGRTYDMGAVFTTSSYDEVQALARRFGVSIIPLQDHSENNLVDATSGLARVRTPLETAELGSAAYDYLQLLESYPSILRPGFRELDPELCLSLSDWMKKRSHLPASLNDFFGYTFTPFGYGFKEQVPAAYALKYYEKRLVQSLLSGNNLGMLRNGYQSLWESVARGLDVRLGTPVLRVRRPRSPAPFVKAPIEVETALGTQRFDHLIVTTLPEDTLRYLDATAEEARDLSRARRYNYYSVAVELPPGFTGAGFIRENYVRERSGHPLCWFKRWSDGNIAVFYALSEEAISESEIAHTLRIDSNRYGWNLGAIRMVKRWHYFPHFTGSDLAGGVYDRLEGRQGFLNTFVAGEIMNFSTVELVTRYAKDLVGRFF